MTLVHNPPAQATPLLPRSRHPFLPPPPLSSSLTSPALFFTQQTLAHSSPTAHSSSPPLPRSRHPLFPPPVPPPQLLHLFVTSCARACCLLRERVPVPPGTLLPRGHHSAHPGESLSTRPVERGQQRALQLVGVVLPPSTLVRVLPSQQSHSTLVVGAGVTEASTATPLG